MRAYQTLVNTQAPACKLTMIEGITAFVLPDGADMSANVSIKWHHFNRFSRAYFRKTYKQNDSSLHSDFVGEFYELFL